VYAGWVDAPLDVVERAGPPASFAQALAAVLLAFMLVPLVAGWRRPRRGWDYPQLFETSWRNALLCIAVAGLTGIFWGVLFTGAALMESLGITFFMELFQEEVFAIPVTGTVVGAIFAVALSRSHWLVNVRHFWLALNAWLLPLLLFFGVIWVLAIPTNGLDALFATRNAAYFLLWFCVLAVKFSNAAWQDGTEAPAYPGWLARALTFAWLSLLVISSVALWAVSLRVNQYGWTEDRIWACVIALIAMMYAVGFSVSVFGKKASGQWMWSIGKTNIAVALTASVLLALLVSPLADPRRIAVNSQLARLQSGKVTPGDFDYRHLRWQSGQWGLRALKSLAANRSDATAVEIADRAQQALDQKNRWADGRESADIDVLARRLKVLPDGSALPGSLMAQLKSDETVSWELNRCKQPNQDCTVWLNDFNADQQPEALFIIAANPTAEPELLLLSTHGEQWKLVARYHASLTQQQIIEAIVSGRTGFVAPEWPDLFIEQQRLRVDQQ
jgi:hypothetical protein